MKKRIDLFWYFFLIIVAFVICFMFSSTRASAASSGGVVVDPGDNSGDMSVNPPISGEELYEQCHTYITTNIISAESLTEALNGKIYGNFTQEDCMEMINIASKREVIKNLVDIKNDGSSYQECGIIRTYMKDYVLLNGVSTCDYNINIPLKNYVILESGNTYSFKVFTDDYYEGWTILSEQSNNSIISQFYFPNSKKMTFTANNNITGGLYFRIWCTNGKTFNNVKLKFQLEKGSTATRYVSYDYHREYYEEGITDADNRVNTNSTSYTQGVTDADNRVNTNSTNYKAGVNSGYEKASKDGESLGTLIPNLLGGFGSFFLTLLNIDILGFNLLSIFGIAITIGIIILILKFMRG